MNWIGRVSSILALLHASAGLASAQHIFLDTNGDGVYSTADRLSATGGTRVDVWLETDRNRDSSPALSVARNGVPVSLFGYEFILRAVGGTVDWGAYANNLSPADAFPARQSPAHFYAGYCLEKVLPPGKYLLGGMVVKVTSGKPALEFASSAPGWLGLQTSFASLNPGKDKNYTLRFTDDPKRLGDPCADIPGDWSDADGLMAGSISLAAALAAGNVAPLRFGVTVEPNPLNPDATLTVTTTRSGFLRVRLYDVGGRLVDVLHSEESAGPGIHPVRLRTLRGFSQLASGVYFYTVDATEGRLGGRVVILK